jgi:hypothetical protein
VLEEIITGDILARVWTALLRAVDRQHGTEALEPVGQSILSSHREALHRGLKLLVAAPAIDAELAMKLDRLRRTSERWNDLLVGGLWALGDVSEFAVDRERAEDFALAFESSPGDRSGPLLWSLVLGSAESALAEGMAPVSPNADLNSRIAGSVLRCFDPRSLATQGTIFASLPWRMTHLVNHAESLIDQIL